MSQEHIITARITVKTEEKATAAAEVHELLAYAFEVSNDQGMFTAFDVPPQASTDLDEQSNEGRAARAETTLEAFKVDRLGEAGPVCIDTVTDFLTDLRHFCDAKGFDLYMALQASYQFYCAEKHQ